MTEQDFSDRHILVIDDLYAARRITRRLLGKLGYTNVDEATNGQQALEILRNDNQYLAVICDLNLGDMTAIELLEQLYSDGQVDQNLFILITSDANRDSVEKAKKFSINSFLLKPFNSHALNERLKELWELQMTP